MLLGLFRQYLMAIAASDGKAQGAWTQVGVLTCRLNPSIGFIIIGHASVHQRMKATSAGLWRDLTPAHPAC